jgi:hypothetical protein
VRCRLEFNNTLRLYCLCLFKRLVVAVFFHRTAFRDFVHFQKFVTALSIVVNIKKIDCEPSFSGLKRKRTGSLAFGCLPAFLMLL